MLHIITKGIKVADAIKIAYQLTLRWVDYTGGPNITTSTFKSRDCVLAMVRKGCDNGRRVRARYYVTCFDDAGIGP